MKEHELLKQARDWIDGNGRYDKAKQLVKDIDEALANHIPDAENMVAQPEQEQIAVWLEKNCDEQYLADRVRAGDYAKEKGHTVFSQCAPLTNDVGDHQSTHFRKELDVDDFTSQPEQKKCDNCGEFGECCQAPPKQEPVAHTAIFHCPNCEYPHRQVTHITGLAQPPWLPQRKPLTDEQIDEEFALYASQFDTFSDEWQDMGAGDYFKAGFKAAHGIKE